MTDKKKVITENKVDFENMKSSGPGGQGADASSSAVRLRVKVKDLPLDDKEKEFVREYVQPHHKTKDGDEILVKNGEERSQEENKQKALEIANEEIIKAVKKGYKQQKHKKWKEEHKEIQKKASSGSSKPARKVKDKKKQAYEGETTEELMEEARKHGEVD